MYSYVIVNTLERLEQECVEESSEGEQALLSAYTSYRYCGSGYMMTTTTL